MEHALNNFTHQGTCAVALDLQSIESKSAKACLLEPGAPLRILGPLDSIFTWALLRSRRGGGGGGGGGGGYIL